MEKLRDVEKELAMCIKDKKCTYGEWPDNLPMCPPYNKFGFFTYCGGGMLYLGRALLLSLIEPSPELLKVLSTCTMCGFCGNTCKLVSVASPHFSVHEMISIIKAEMIEQDIARRIVQHLVHRLPRELFVERRIEQLLDPRGV